MDLDRPLDDEHQEPETSSQERLARKASLKKRFNQKKSKKRDEEKDDDRSEPDDEIQASADGSPDLTSKSHESDPTTNEVIPTMKDSNKMLTVPPDHYDPSTVEKDGESGTGSIPTHLTSKEDQGRNILIF